jgi:hypothetical protein
VQGLVGTPGHFYVVAVPNTGEMQLFWRNNDIPGNKTWTAGEIFGSGIASSPPCMIQGNYGTANELQPGNFELCVAHNGQIQHGGAKTATSTLSHLSLVTSRSRPRPCGFRAPRSAPISSMCGH